MSADNGFVVSPLYMRPGKFGIFYYGSGDEDNPAQYYIRDNTVNNIEYNSAVKAIIFAHIHNQDAQTEYGVYVHSMALARAEEEIR